MGLPASGRGSVASWGSRIIALIIDWGACMLVAVAVFGIEVLTGSGWRTWMILATFFVETSLLGWLRGASLGQLIIRIGILRIDRAPMSPGRAIVRAGLVCLVLPAVLIGADRRGLHDMAAGTVMVNRRDT